MNEKILALTPKYIKKPNSVSAPSSMQKQKKIQAPQEVNSQSVQIPIKDLNICSIDQAKQVTLLFKTALVHSKTLSPSPKTVIFTTTPTILPVQRNITINNKNQLQKEQEKQDQLKKNARQRQEHIQNQNLNKPKIQPQLQPKIAPQPITNTKLHPFRPTVQLKPKPKVHQQRDYELNDGVSRTLVTESTHR